MAVRIDMDMPKSCFDCEFLVSFDNKTQWLCSLTRICLEEKDDFGKRQSWCPLKECK